VSWLGIIVLFVLVDNVFLSRLLGVSPAAGTPARMRTAVGTGLTTAILMTISALAAWVLNSLLLVPLGLGFLRTPAYVLSVAGLALALDALGARSFPLLVRSAGFSLAGTAIGTAALGTILIVTHDGYSVVQCLVGGAAAGAGYILVLSLMASIQERLDIEQAPEALRGLPLHLISAGLLAYAFMAFDRAFLARLLGG
jgi:Na+-translocating ferredoxin:NAD+ oxidoreductase subunit A